MKTLIFIHGGESFTDESAYQAFLRVTYIVWQSEIWTPEMKTSWTQEIAKKWYTLGNQVYMPVFPNKLDAKYEEWKLVFDGIIGQLDPDDEITLVGGSLGGCFLLKYFSEQNGYDNSVILTQEESLSDSSYEKYSIAGSDVKEKGIPTVGQIIRIHQIHLVAACIAEGDFSTPTNYEFLKHLGNRVHIWHAEDDRVVPFTIGQELSLVLPDAVFHPFAPDRGYGHFYGIPAFPELENELLER